MFVKVIAASNHPLATIRPLITLHLHYPRFIHSELMTHRVFSRNARSSRAVPISRMIEEVKTNPVIPWHWGKNQKGMQAFEECSANVTFVSASHPAITGNREAMWLKARDYAVEAAEGFMNAGYHKQLVNRLLEPFMWIDTLITATDFDNFFALRCHKDAEPHFHDLAVKIRDAVENTSYKDLDSGEWHLPYITDDDKTNNANDLQTLLSLSAARCARISYKPFDGKDDIASELARFNKLVGANPIHASPVEHQAEAVLDLGLPSRNFCRGWFQHRILVENQLQNNTKSNTHE